MPVFISLRDFRLTSLSGHSAVFVANTPRFIPDALVDAALAAGCVPADMAAAASDETKAALFKEDSSRARVQFGGTIRQSMVYLAIKKVAARNNAKDFDGGGTPKTAVITELLGYEIQRAEVTEMYQKFLEMQQAGTEYELHPQAHNVMKVIEADSKAELAELAEEFGFTADTTKGLTVRDLRKKLLVKLSGFTAD